MYSLYLMELYKYGYNPIDRRSNSPKGRWTDAQFTEGTYTDCPPPPQKKKW